MHHAVLFTQPSSTGLLSPMFTDRVLPRPPGLADRDIVPSWITVRADSCDQQKMMTNGISVAAAKDLPISPISSEESNSPPSDKEPFSSSVEPPADSISETSKIQTRSSSKNSKGENGAVAKRLPSVSWQEDSPSDFCLCQPDPKIPRPRNAFILYRQHYQSAVVAQHPGLANPEISKVIGDRWRSSAPEVKKHWKNLAEEEKLRHQKQYPDYRYQPKRNGRNNSLSNSLPSATSASGSDDRRCPKCGGRSITTPMSGSNLPTGAGNPPSTPYSPNHPASTPLTGSSAHRFLHSLGSPPANGSPGGLRSRPTTSAGNLSAQQLASPRFTHGDSVGFPLSPDLKRRRIVNGTYPAVRTANGPLTPFPFPQGHRRGSLPRPEFMPSLGYSKQHNMGPPPRPKNWDTSLTLAPLQMGSPNPGSTASKHSKSIEAMLMAIPPINKIRLLAKISPPLSQPDPGSPAEKARGFVISVDGPDDASVAQVTETLLMSFPRNPVRVFERPLNLFHSESTGTVDDDTDEFGSCITAMAKYHILSKEIISYITTPATSAAYTTSPSTSMSPVSPKTMPLSKESVRSSVHQVSDDETANIPTGVPIAVVPSFQLSHTDTFASRVHITDAYAPVDHWQWMATLWRGIVGPDITIAILPPPTPQSSTSAKSGSEMSKSMSARGTPRGNVSCGSGVEIRLEDARAILVRVDEKGVGEGSLRRVGFEVGEWVRSKEEGGMGN